MTRWRHIIPTETDFVQLVIDYLRRCGIHCWRQNSGGRGRIIATAEYKAFRDGMALLFRAQAGGKQLRSPDVRMRVSLPQGSRIDRNNLIKPTQDALELAGIIANDRELNRSHFHLEPVEDLPTGSDEEITLILSGGEDWPDRKDPGRETGGTD